MHECKICGETTSFSLAASVCFICARKIRAALNRYEDQKAQSRYREAGNDRASEHSVLWSNLPYLKVGKANKVVAGMVCREGHALSGREDACGQVRCEPCDALVTPREPKETCMEQLRSIKVTVEVMTNKVTHLKTFELGVNGESLEEVIEEANEWAYGVLPE